MLFSNLVVAYLFLGGCGGGGCAVCAVLGLLADGGDVRCGLASRFRTERGVLYARFFGGAIATSLAALALGAVCLLADMGRPDRVLLLALSAPTTYLVVGFWSLSLCGALALAVALVWAGVMPARLPAFRVLNVLLAVAGVACAVYTGLLLSGIPAVPLWNTPLLVAVFLLSSVSGGVSVVVLSGWLFRVQERFACVMHRLSRVDSWLILLEAACIAWWLFAVGQGAWAEDPPTFTSSAAASSLESLLVGSVSPWFWGGLVVLGLAIPFLVERVARAVPTRPLGLYASLCVLAGVAVFRYVVVAAAAQPAAFLV